MSSWDVQVGCVSLGGNSRTSCERAFANLDKSRLPMNILRITGTTRGAGAIACHRDFFFTPPPLQEYFAQGPPDFHGTTLKPICSYYIILYCIILGTFVQ